ncbi:MAG: hypothetical protein Q9M23_03475, partial [Mariprofundaceae bacterium]|nr:hypothetical protein [Mariprofundaceae bacterium]
YGHHHVKGFLGSDRTVAVEQVNAAEGRHFTLQQLDYHMQLTARSEKPLSLLLLKIPKGKGSAAEDKLEVRLSLVAHELCRLLRLTIFRPVSIASPLPSWRRIPDWREHARLSAVFWPN